MTTRAAARPHRRVAVLSVAVLGTVASVVVLVWMLPGAAASRAIRQGRPVVAVYDPPRSSLEVALNRGDGQAFAALAVDPALRRPEVFRQGRHVAAYRAARPLLGWLAWASSGGRPSLVPLALAGWTLIGASVLFASVARLLAMRHAPVSGALLVAALPGIVVTLTWMGPELLATGLAFAGLAWWVGGRRLPAIACFALAGLARETLLVVPLAIAVDELLERRPRLDRVLLPAVSAWPLLAWMGVVRLRFRAWPTGMPGNVSAPLAGFVQGTSRWGAFDALAAIIGGLLVIAALSSDDRLLRLVAVAHLALAVVLGHLVWETYTGFARVLLPMYAAGVVAIVPRRTTALQAGRIQSRISSSRRSAHSSEVIA